MKKIIKLWKFASKSNPKKIHETLLYNDNSTSCGCQGWINKKEDKDRTCRHVRSVEAGTADQECITFTDYTQSYPTPRPKPQSGKTDNKKAGYHKIATPEPKPAERLMIPVVRKIQW